VQTVVLVHAFGSIGRAWAPQVAGLGDRYRVLAPDLPGHGGTAGPFTLDRAGESVRAVIADAGGRAHLVGISGGATVALLTYLEDPGRVASLVLSAGVAHAPRLVSLQRAIQRAIPEPVLARLLRGWYSGGRPEYEQVAAEDFRRCGKRTFLAALSELAHVGLRGRLGDVAVPTLVACGARDRVNLGPSREIAAGVATAELRIVPDAVHLWNLQQPELFNETVAEFVARPSDHIRGSAFARKQVDPS
jgi:3-oxoadipate enol-lactonase